MTTHNHRARPPLSALLCLAGALSCAAAGGNDSAALRWLINDAACTSDDQCRTIAIGTSACGGPAAYLPWSVQRTQQAALQDAAARYSAHHTTAPTRRGEPSTCRVLPDPGAVCQPAAAGSHRGTCRLRDRHGAAVAPTQ